MRSFRSWVFTFVCALFVLTACSPADVVNVPESEKSVSIIYEYYASEEFEHFFGDAIQLPTVYTESGKIGLKNGSVYLKESNYDQKHSNLKNPTGVTMFDIYGHVTYAPSTKSCYFSYDIIMSDDETNCFEEVESVTVTTTYNLSHCSLLPNSDLRCEIENLEVTIKPNRITFSVSGSVNEDNRMYLEELVNFYSGDTSLVPSTISPDSSYTIDLH